MRFANRLQAGDVLAQKLLRYRDDPTVVVLALPRGGVPVAFQVAHALHAPLDVFIVRKLGLPGHEEFAMGAIASGGVMVMNPDLANFHIPEAAIEDVAARERTELDRRERAFRAGRPRLDIAGRTVIVVDDGLATGASMAAAIDALRTRKPARAIGAVPVAPPEVCDALGDRADEMVCLLTPVRLHAVGVWYADFTQTSDDEVRALLDAAARARKAQGAPRGAEPASSAR